MTENKINLPEKITLNGQEINVAESPELINLLSIAQKIEKDKLYPTIEKLKTQVTEKETELAKLKVIGTPTPNNINQPITQDKLREEMKKIQAEDKTEPLNAEKVADILFEKWSNALPDLIKAQVEKSIEPIKTATSSLFNEQLTDYRNRRLIELSDQIIPELVTGNTKDEIEQSIINSIEVRKRYQENKPANVVKPIETPGVTPPAPLPRIVTPSGNPDEEIDIKGMGAKEFEKNREELLKKFKDMGSNAGYATLKGANSMAEQEQY